MFERIYSKQGWLAARLAGLHGRSLLLAWHLARLASSGRSSRQPGLHYKGGCEFIVVQYWKEEHNGSEVQGGSRGSKRWSAVNLVNWIETAFFREFIRRGHSL